MITAGESPNTIPEREIRERFIVTSFHSPAFLYFDKMNRNM